jgi:hypothetical protein
MADYKTFANLAKNGQKTFMFSHSQVPTYTYESTQECGDELMQSLGIAAAAYNVNGLGTLNFYRRAEAGNFRLWGALGSDGDSHLEHLRYIGEFLEELPIAKLVPGDYNNSSVVDAADYVLWRNSIGRGTLPNEGGISPGTTDAADYSYWRSRFGVQAAMGVSSSFSLGTTVPEPLPVSMLVVCASLAAPRRRFNV